MSLEHITLAFLVVFFIAVEIWRIWRGRHGVIVAVSDDSDFPIPLPVTSVQVRLEDGTEVKANMNCCTACLGRLQIGDQVKVSQSRDGWVVDLPWFRKSTCNGC